MAENRLLGEIMIEMGLASRELIIDCLNMQTEIHKRGQGQIPIGKILMKTGHVTHKQLEEALDRQARYHLPN